jgi:hypothetical protein
MKSYLKFSLLAVTATILGTAASLADNPQLRNALQRERMQAEREVQAPTVGVQVRGRGLGERKAEAARGHYTGDSDSVVLHRGRGQAQTIHTSPR